MGWVDRPNQVLHVWMGYRWGWRLVRGWGRPCVSRMHQGGAWARGWQLWFHANVRVLTCRSRLFEGPIILSGWPQLHQHQRQLQFGGCPLSHRRVQQVHRARLLQVRWGDWKISHRPWPCSLLKLDSVWLFEIRRRVYRAGVSSNLGSDISQEPDNLPV